ncbi:PAS-domain containing protein, partial [Methylobacterium hispanicum]
QRLLDVRLAQNDARARWVRWLVIGGSALAVLTLLWAARLLNQAWSRSFRTEAEQRDLALRLRTTLDSLSQGVAVFGPDRKLASWNACFQVLLDLPKAMLRPSTTYAAFVEHSAEPGRPALETEDQIRHGIRNPREAVTYERERADGHHLEIRRTPMPDGGFVLTISDMTKRAQAEGVLREAQKMQAIGQLTGGIAHDFNNLLQVILGNLEFVRAKLEGDAKLQQRIERAAWAAQRGATLTAQLLAFARKQPLAPAAIDLAATMP